MTRAEMFRYLAERSGLKRVKQPRASASASAAHRAEEPHNASARAGRSAGYALEPSGGRVSRKSTRKSANRQKTDVQFRMKRRVQELQPH